MYYDSYDPNAVWAALGSYMACIFFFAIVLVALMIWVYWRILSKAGYNGAWALLVLVPFIGGFAGLGILLVLAFGNWPALRRQAYAPPSVPPYQPPAPPIAPMAAEGTQYQGYSGPPAAPYVEPPVPTTPPATAPPVAMPVVAEGAWPEPQPAAPAAPPAPEVAPPAPEAVLPAPEAAPAAPEVAAEAPFEIASEDAGVEPPADQD